jgi:hypothetical protein
MTTSTWKISDAKAQLSEVVQAILLVRHHQLPATRAPARNADVPIGTQNPTLSSPFRIPHFPKPSKILRPARDFWMNQKSKIQQPSSSAFRRGVSVGEFIRMADRFNLGFFTPHR